jgi:hypothetical protein
MDDLTFIYSKTLVPLPCLLMRQKKNSYSNYKKHSIFIGGRSLECLTEAGSTVLLLCRI